MLASGHAANPSQFARRSLSNWGSSVAADAGRLLAVSAVRVLGLQPVDPMQLPVA